jgi:hypothetical protein
MTHIAFIVIGSILVWLAVNDRLNDFWDVMK